MTSVRASSSAAQATRTLFLAEPRPVYRPRAPLVADCSVIASSLFEEVDAGQATEALRDHELHAPALLPFEFANVARSKSRAGAPAERLAMALQAFEGLRVELHPVDVTRLHALALRHRITAYDAAYLALALALPAPLLTFDRGLADAAARAQGEPR
ncbi:MAG: type II toxin-antitoxin system VapC family toxin [Rhodoferax sp.]|nr:type II toxin-antitoxin system VapC family toxin [Rhodoferax sp.]MCP5289441.1 type II toxin-antitoxin system VapC family toxin [Burkholderiaceae bacterium]